MKSLHNFMVIMKYQTTLSKTHTKYQKIRYVKKRLKKIPKKDLSLRL